MNNYPAVFANAEQQVALDRQRKQKTQKVSRFSALINRHRIYRNLVSVNRPGVQKNTSQTEVALCTEEPFETFFSWRPNTERRAGKYQRLRAENTQSKGKKESKSRTRRRGRGERESLFPQ